LITRTVFANSRRRSRALKADTVVLDGEVAVVDEKLVSRFHLFGDNESVVLTTPPVFIARLHRPSSSPVLIARPHRL
jgi:hypothetical protein